MCTHTSSLDSYFWAVVQNVRVSIVRFFLAARNVRGIIRVQHVILVHLRGNSTSRHDSTRLYTSESLHAVSNTIQIVQIQFTFIHTISTKEFEGPGLTFCPIVSNLDLNASFISVEKIVRYHYFKPLIKFVHDSTLYVNSIHNRLFKMANHLLTLQMNCLFDSLVALFCDFLFGFYYSLPILIKCSKTFNTSSDCTIMHCFEHE